MKCDGCLCDSDRLTPMYGKQFCDECVEAIATVPGREVDRRKGKGNTHRRQRRGK